MRGVQSEVHSNVPFLPCGVLHCRQRRVVRDRGLYFQREIPIEKSLLTYAAVRLVQSGWQADEGTVLNVRLARFHELECCDVCSRVGKVRGGLGGKRNAS